MKEVIAHILEVVVVVIALVAVIAIVSSATRVDKNNTDSISGGAITNEVGQTVDKVFESTNGAIDQGFGDVPGENNGD